MQKLFTVRKIWKDRRIYWVKSYKATLSYMDTYASILKPTILGTKSGKRYYVSEENLKAFIRKFENNELN